VVAIGQTRRVLADVRGGPGVRAAGYLDGAGIRRPGDARDRRRFVDWSPVWSHDGRHLYFCSNRSGSANVWRIRVDEDSGRALGEPEPITLPATFVMRVSFAADGTRFAYEAADLQANVQRIAFDPISETVRGEAVAVTSGARVWADVDVATDGRLAFWSQLRQEDVHVSSADGGAITPLAPDAANDRVPRWSPDGAWIAFASLKAGTPEYQIHVIRPDGRDLRRVAHFEKGSTFFPLWSPDGRQLAFTASVAAGGHTYAIDVESGWPARTLKLLLTPPGPPDIRYRPWSWSPDGRWIAAYSERGAGMIVYEVATGAHREISPVGAKPRWLGDSRRLIYTAAGALHVIDVRTKRTREIHRLTGATIIDPAISRDDRTLYFIRQRDEGDVWVGTLK
jgi:Tol biopolymer transport system component